MTVLVAQLVEQYTFNVWALGSNPSQVTFLKTNFFILIFCDLVFEGFLLQKAFDFFVQPEKLIP